MKSKLRIMIEQIIKEEQTPQIFKKLFKRFPRDAKGWNQADDTLRDIARMTRETYNELEHDFTKEDENDPRYVQPLNFRSFKTPSEWNSKAQDFIVSVYNKMSPSTKKDLLRRLKSYSPYDLS